MALSIFSQHPDFKHKMMATKIRNGSFTKSNSSKIATEYFRDYVKIAGYSLTQVAYADGDNGLFEWGHNVNGKWILYDFVAFEEGFRGNKAYVEIIEYHGPFHYTNDDVDTRGEEMAYPWKSKNITIKESYQLDRFKQRFAESLTGKYSILWDRDLRTK